MLVSDFAQADWCKSSRSLGQNDQCVEVAAVHGLIGVRDSKNVHGPLLVLPRSAFRVLSAEIRNGTHDL
ncbi:DUF397 domain-containing protein [Actinomadura kijaniata]|uniref:DUF397 domain-containing protein n=1 Tax=Actinomadura kijaniata TaxID=46161 RepID=UPI000A019BA4|nr:DUF397 domain-containing protein [Actinomadura kijaniata]